MGAIAIRTASIPSTHHLRLAIVVPLSVYRVPTAQLYGACSCRRSVPLPVAGVPNGVSLWQAALREGSMLKECRACAGIIEWRAMCKRSKQYVL